MSLKKKYVAIHSIQHVDPETKETVVVDPGAPFEPESAAQRDELLKAGAIAEADSEIAEMAVETANTGDNTGNAATNDDTNDRDNDGAGANKAAAQKSGARK